MKWLAVAALGGACLGIALLEVLITHALNFHVGKYAVSGIILIAIVTHKLSRQRAPHEDTN